MERAAVRRGESGQTWASQIRHLFITRSDKENEEILRHGQQGARPTSGPSDG